MTSRLKTLTALVSLCLAFGLQEPVAIQGSGAFDHAVMATPTGSLRVIDDAVSVNARGRVAFLGEVTDPASGQPAPHVFAAGTPGGVVDLSPALGSDSRPSIGPGVILNDADRALVRRVWYVWFPWPVMADAPVSTLETWDAGSPGAYAELVRASPFHEFDGVLGYPTINNLGSFMLVGFKKSAFYLAAQTAGWAGKGSLSDSSLRPLLADNNVFLVQIGSPAVIRVHSAEGYPPLATIASEASGYGILGRSPGLSDDGEAVAFYGDPDLPTATALGTVPGPGVFLSLQAGSPSTRRIFRLTGWFDASTIVFEPVINGNALEPVPACFADHDQHGAIRVARRSLGQPGWADDALVVTFLASPTRGSSLGHWSDRPGLWTIRADIPHSGLPATGARLPTTRARPVVQLGDAIGGGAVDSLQLYDPLALPLYDLMGNRIVRPPGDHWVAFAAGSGTGRRVVRSAYTGADAAFTAWSQCDLRWWTKPYANTHRSMCSKGCALTTLASALAGHGLPTRPDLLHDTLLTSDPGFAASGDVVLSRVVPLVSHGQLRFVEAIISSRWQPDNARAFLDNALIHQRRAVVVAVDPRAGIMHHRVLVVGKRGNEYLIADVGYPNKATLSAWNDRYEIRGYIEPTRPSVLLREPATPPGADGETTAVETSGVVDVLVLDAQDHKCGRLGEETFTEIPFSVYYADAFERSEEGQPADPAPPAEVYQHLRIDHAAGAEHRLILVGRQDAPYTVRIYRGLAAAPFAEDPEILTGVIRSGEQVERVLRPAGPSLALEPRGGAWRLGWSSRWGDWQLEFSPVLHPPAWSSISPPRETEGNRTSVPLEGTSNQGFYRLVQP